MKFEEITELAVHGVDLDIAMEDDGGTPKHIAAFYGHANVLAELGNRNVNLNTASKYCFTLLFYAALNGHAQAVVTLLEFNVNIDLPLIESANTLRNIASSYNVEVANRMERVCGGLVSQME